MLLNKCNHHIYFKIVDVASNHGNKWAIKLSLSLVLEGIPLNVDHNSRIHAKLDDMIDGPWSVFPNGFS